MNKKRNVRYRKLHPDSYLREYRDKIRSGDIQAGRELTQQLDNLIADLENPNTPTTPATQNQDLVHRALRKHTKSPFYGLAFKLELWEKH